MASRRHLIAALWIASALLAGCSSSAPKSGDQLAQWDAHQERKAEHIARDYLREHGKFVATDRYVASPYDNGWMVRINRQIGTNVDGSPWYDPGDTRFVRLDSDWKVVEYFPGAGVD